MTSLENDGFPNLRWKPTYHLTYFFSIFIPSAIRNLRQILRRADKHDVGLVLARLHLAEVQQNRIQPTEEIAFWLELLNLADCLGKRPKHQLFRIAIVVAQKRSCGIKPIAILGDKPLCATLGVFFISCQTSISHGAVCPSMEENAKFAKKVHSNADNLAVKA